MLRLFFPQPTYSALLGSLGSYYETSAYNTFTLKPGYEGFEPSQEFPGQKVKVSINQYGFRGEPVPSSSANTILVLGDSYTFGVYVSDDETYPAVLNKLVQRRNDKWHVINGGYVGGFETDQQYVWLKKNIEKINPKMVVLGVFLGNDILGINEEAWLDLDQYGLPSKWVDENLTVDASGRLANKVAGVNTVGVESVYKLPVLRESHFFVLLGRAVDKIYNKLADRKVTYGVESFKHIYGEYSPGFLGKEKKFLELVARMKRLVEQRGGDFVVALLPINFMVDRELLKKVLPADYETYVLQEPVYYDRLAKILEEKDIPYVNIYSAMRESQEARYFPTNGEVHFNPVGNSFVAKKLYDYLVNRQILK